MNQVELPKNPHAIVSLGGKIFDSWINKELFKSVNVQLPTNQTAEGRIQFFDPEFRIIDSFATAGGIGTIPVMIWLGYGKNLGEPIFEGVLAQIERGDSHTTFIAFDMGFKMKLVKKAGYKNKKNDLEILKLLAARNFLGFEGPENPLPLEPHRAMMQDEQTDWEHAMERARDAGLVLFVRRQTLYAKYPAKITTPVLTLKNRKDFVLKNSFDFIYRTPENVDNRPRVVKVRRRGKAGKRVEGLSNVTNDKRENVVLKRDSSTPTKSKLSRRAQAQKDLEREHAFEGHIECVFPPNGERLDVRNTISIQGIGAMFSNEYICDTVDYNYAPGELGLRLGLYRDIK